MLVRDKGLYTPSFRSREIQNILMSKVLLRIKFQGRYLDRIAEVQAVWSIQYNMTIYKNRPNRQIHCEGHHPGPHWCPVLTRAPVDIEGVVWLAFPSRSSYLWCSNHGIGIVKTGRLGTSSGSTGGHPPSLTFSMIIPTSPEGSTVIHGIPGHFHISFKPSCLIL